MTPILKRIRFWETVELPEVNLETLRAKRHKSRLAVTYSYLCAVCEEIEEAPDDLRCCQCGALMVSVSGFYKKELVLDLQRRLGKAQERKAKKEPPEVKILEAPNTEGFFFTARHISDVV